MSDLNDLPITDLAQSLFSPDEMRHLVQTEIQRAQRYGFPLTLYLIGVDRLDALHDLYGSASKAEILTGLLQHLRHHVRASDMLASLQGDRLLLVSPYADRVGSKRLAQRMLEGARSLRFESDNRDLHVSLSIGMAHTTQADPDDQQALFRAADDAQRLASRNGGDRVVEVDLLDAPTPGTRRGSRAIEPGGPPTLPQDPPDEAADGAIAAEAPSPANPLAGLTAQDVIVVVREALAQLGVDPGRLATGPSAPEEAPAPAAASTPASAPVAGEESGLQDRRISKLADAVEGLQRQLSALATSGGSAAEAGVASLGKVFGAIGEGGEDDDKRKELMGALFRANMSLQKRRAAADGDDAV